MLRGLQSLLHLLDLGLHIAQQRCVGALCIHVTCAMHSVHSPPSELQAKKALARPTMTDNFGAGLFSNVVPACS